LKQADQRVFPASEGIARQQWRARIETSPVLVPVPGLFCIARQQWRARIETRPCP